MSAMRMAVSVCAAVLLVASTSGQFADSVGIKDLLFGQKSYAILADHLYKVTTSAELADNTKAAGSLLSEHTESKEDIKMLVHAFGSLKGDPSVPEGLCSKDNLANLRRVSEALRDGGNLGPKKITAAINRLNKIVIKVIEDARKVCDPYLTGKWPESWQSDFSDPAMKDRIVNLRGVAKSYLYEGFAGPTADLSLESNWPSRTMSDSIRKSEWQATDPIDPTESLGHITENTNVISKQLDEYVYKPCAEFVFFDAAKEVLVPFNDMLRSWFVVNTGLMDKYYENEDKHYPYVRVHEFDTAVRDLAFSYQACQLFLATPNKDLANRIRKFRVAENRT